MDFEWSSALGWLAKLFSNAKNHADYDDPDGIESTEIIRVDTKSMGESRLPQFQEVATGQLRGSQHDDEHRIRLKLRDAFTPSQPVANIHQFAGRTDTLRHLIRALEDQRLHVVLYGERGMGKTSLLRVLMQLAGQAQYIVRYISCGETSNFSDTFRVVAADIPLLYHDDYDPTTAETESGKTLDALLPDGPLGSNQISDLFAKLSGTRVLVVLDEFDRSPDGPFRRSVAELIKSLSDRSIRVQLVIAGVAGNLAELVEHIPSIRRNVLGLRVPNMTLAEIREMIHIGEASSGLSFDRKTVDLIARYACGSPYLASLLAQHAALYAVDAGRQSVQAGDVAQAVALTVTELAQRLSERTIRVITRLRVTDGAALARIAEASLVHGGRIEPGEGLLDAPTRKTITDIAIPNGVMEACGEDGEALYRFTEESIASYLWLLQAADDTRTLMPPARV